MVTLEILGGPAQTTKEIAHYSIIKREETVKQWP